MSVLRWTDEQLAAHKAKNARKPAQKAPQATPAAPKPSKYRNAPTDGYASKKEAKRAGELKAMQAAGIIRDLEEQVKYELVPRQNDDGGKCLFRAVTYTLDFQYYDIQAGEWHFEDVKGYANDRWPMKKALMYHVHKILVEEV